VSLNLADLMLEVKDGAKSFFLLKGELKKKCVGDWSTQSSIAIDKKMFLILLSLCYWRMANNCATALLLFQKIFVIENLIIVFYKKYTKF